MSEAHDLCAFSHRERDARLECAIHRVRIIHQGPYCRHFYTSLRMRRPIVERDTDAIFCAPPINQYGVALGWISKHQTGTIAVT